MIALESTKLFGGLSRADLELLQSSAEVRNFSNDDVIFKEGDAGDGLYVVRSGAVQISAFVGQAEPKPLAHLKPGDYFGEMAVIDDQPRSASATAEGDTTVYYLPRELVLKMLEHSPLLAVRFVREFSHRMREFNKQYVNEALQAERLTLVGRFARSIVHDFKNPLNVIGLAAEMAGLDHSTPAMRTSANVRIRRQVDRLSNMINELLEFTRDSRNAVVLASTHYGRFIEQIIQDLKDESADKKVEIIFENEPPDIELLLDPQRLTHVFNNLIHNAVDAMMPDGGKIFLRFRSTPTELVTEIEDTGKGIPPEIAPRLFEAFATFGKSNGTGLGLSICQRIITDHKGRIDAHSPPGRGAVFTFTLPLQTI